MILILNNMINLSRFINKFLLITILLSTIFCNSRLAFSRPGSFMRSPSDIAGSLHNNYFVGISTEIINTSNFNYSRSLNFHSTTSGKFSYGLNFLTHATNNTQDLDPPSEFLFHFTKEIYRFNNLIINIGVHDIPIASDFNDPRPSLFLSFINKNFKIGEKYFLQSAVGLGSEKINFDSHNTALEQENHANVFVGFKLKTPWREEKIGRGTDVLFDYIDNGYHLGFDMPITYNLNFQFGLTHLENYQTMNDYDDAALEGEQIFGDDAAFAFSFQYMIPTKNNQKKLPEEDLEKVSIMEPENNCYIGLTQNDDYISQLQINEGCSVSSVKQIVEAINSTFQSYEDSLLFLNQTLTSYDLTKNALEVKVDYLQDSLKTQEINYYISKTELNIAIKSLTNSLKYYYSNEYHLALKELDKTIKYLPNLAVAYARRGSIYYKLADLDRATINWNHALQLDPEYVDVKNILLQLKTNSVDSSYMLPE